MAYQKPVVHKTPLKRQAEIKEIIESKGVDLTPCSRCQHDNITIFEASLRLNVRIDLKRRPERYFSVAIVMCDNCGHKSEFDGQSLGLDEIRTDAFD